MELIHSNVEFIVTEVKFDGSRERITIKLQPNHSLYAQPMPISFRYKHDYNDYKYYRIFMNNNNLSSKELNNLKGRKFIGNIVRFTKKDDMKTQWDGPQSTSLRLQPVDVQLSKPADKTIKSSVKSVQKVTNIMSKKNKNQKSLKQMAIEVLNAAGPLHTKLIWDEIVKQGYISHGKTPDATIAACLYMDLKKNGDNSIFVKTGPNTFDLRARSVVQIITPTITPSVIESAPIIQEQIASPSVSEEDATSLIGVLVNRIKITIENIFNYV
jgi:hypothetical protein